MKKPGQHKSKGSQFERDIAEDLSLWWTYFEDKDVFWRSQASGARATQRRKKGKGLESQQGDITFIDPIGKPLIDYFNIECKTGYSAKNKDKKITNWCILDILDSRQEKTVIEKFWDQCVHDAEVSGRKPLLIFRRPLMSHCVVINADVYNAFSDFFGVFQGKEVRIYPLDLRVIEMKAFFDWTVDIETFIRTKAVKKLTLE